MAISVTVQSVLQNLRLRQSKGSNAATVAGVALVSAAAADAYCNAANLSSFSGWILGYAVRGRLFGFLGICLESIALVIGFLQLRKSKWQTAAAHRFFETMKSGFQSTRDRKRDRKIKEGPSSIFVRSLILASFTFVISSSMIFRLQNHYINLGSNIVLAIIFGTVVAFDLCSIVFVARSDIFVVAGLAMAAAIIVIGQAYGNPMAMLGAADTRYWELTFFIVLALGLLAAFIERAQSREIVLLDLTPASVPDPAIFIPFFAEGTGRSVYVMFHVQGVKLVVLYGTLGEKELTFINVNDSQLCLPIQGHSLTFWNLGYLETMAARGTEVVDSAGCFKAAATLCTMATAADFRRKHGESLDPTVVDFATDVFFNNKNLMTFLHSVGVEVFDACVEPFADEVAQLCTQARKLGREIEFDIAKPFPSEIMNAVDPTNHSAVRQAMSHSFGRQHNETLNRLHERLETSVASGRAAVASADGKWNTAVAGYFEGRVKSANARSDSEHQTASLMKALDLDFAFTGFQATGVSVEVRKILEAVSDQLIELLRLKESAFQAAVKDQADRAAGLAGKVIDSPLLSPAQLANVYEDATGKSLGSRAAPNPARAPPKDPERLN